MNLTNLSARDLAQSIRDRSVSARDVAQACLDQIRRLDDTVAAYLAVDPPDVLAQAAAVDDRIAGGDGIGPLVGVPVAIKDNICIRGTEVTCASRILKGYRAPYEATVVERLRAAGAVLLGKTNLDEFAMGSSTENSAFRLTKNPWDLERIPGGSSGGSAAAVAAREAFAALGSDTGGSIRQPASFCGVVGIKPTYGRVSRYGLVAFASSLDQIGCFARDVADAALVLGVIAGHDPRDTTSATTPVPDYGAALREDLTGLRVGLPKEYFTGGIDPEVEAATRTAADIIASLGAEVVEITLPHSTYAIAAYYIICTAEASSNLARYDGVQYGHRASAPADLFDMYTRTKAEGFGTEVKRRIILGTYVLSSGYYDAYYLKALKVRTLIKRDFDRAFERVAAILAPVSPTTAFRVGEKTDDPLTMYLSDIYTISVNLAGIPGVSVPCGFDSKGLPVGLHIMTKPFDEPTMLRIGYAYQQATDFHTRVPPVVTSSSSKP